jgi:hypothetical protein
MRDADETTAAGDRRPFCSCSVVLPPSIPSSPRKVRELHSAELNGWHRVLSMVNLSGSTGISKIVVDGAVGRQAVQGLSGGSNSASAFVSDSCRAAAAESPKRM